MWAPQKTLRPSWCHKLVTGLFISASRTGRLCGAFVNVSLKMSAAEFGFVCRVIHSKLLITLRKCKTCGAYQFRASVNSLPSWLILKCCVERVTKFQPALAQSLFLAGHRTLVPSLFFVLKVEAGGTVKLPLLSLLPQLG